MKTLQTRVLVLLASLLPACGQQLVEFANQADAAINPTAPVVTSTNPVSDATGVPLTTNVSATFSEAMDPATLFAPIVIVAVNVAPTVRVLEGEKVAV